MAAPNIVAVTEIYGKSAGKALTTSAQTIVSNSASSGKVYKVNTLMIANKDGTNSADATATLVKSGGSSFKLASTVAVDADSTLVVISKDNSVYLEEGDSITVQASASGDLDAVCAWEELND